MRATPAERYVGQKFVRWVALSPAQNGYVRCRCDCGVEKDVLLDNLMAGKSRGCRKCSGMGGNKNPRWVGYRDIPGQLWGVLRSSARARGIPVTITIEDLQRQWETQMGRCALTGLDLVMSSKAKGLTASVDRIDSKRPYEVGNIQFVHKDINLMKNKFPQLHFVEMCRRVAKWCQ